MVMGFLCARLAPVLALLFALAPPCLAQETSATASLSALASWPVGAVSLAGCGILAFWLLRSKRLADARRAALVQELEETTPASVPPPPAIPDGLEHMLPLFIAEMAKDAATLQSLAQAPLAELGEHAHAMRGKCAMFGEDILFDLLTSLENSCQTGSHDGNDVLMALIVERALQLRVYDRSLAAL